MLTTVTQTHIPDERKFRVVVTKDLPGERWLDTLLKAGCQVDICKHADTILSQEIIKKLIGSSETHGVLGQLTEVSRLEPCTCKACHMEVHKLVCSTCCLRHVAMGPDLV